MAFRRVVPLKPVGHQCYRRLRRWAGGVVKDAVCPLCEAHAEKLKAHMRASRARGRLRRRVVVVKD